MHSSLLRADLMEPIFTQAQPLPNLSHQEINVSIFHFATNYMHILPAGIYASGVLFTHCGKPAAPHFSKSTHNTSASDSIMHIAALIEVCLKTKCRINHDTLPKDHSYRLGSTPHRVCVHSVCFPYEDNFPIFRSMRAKRVYGNSESVIA